MEINLKHLLGVLTGANKRASEAAIKRVLDASEPPSDLPAGFAASLTPAERAHFEGGDSDAITFSEAHGHRFEAHRDRGKRRGWFNGR